MTDGGGVGVVVGGVDQVVKVTVCGHCVGGVDQEVGEAVRQAAVVATEYTTLLIAVSTSDRFRL